MPAPVNAAPHPDSYGNFLTRLLNDADAALTEIVSGCDPLRADGGVDDQFALTGHGSSLERSAWLSPP